MLSWAIDCSWKVRSPLTPSVTERSSACTTTTDTGPLVRDPAARGAETAPALMAAPAVTARPERSLPEAARTMRRHRLGRPPVVISDGRLIGIVTGHDLPRPHLREDTAPADEIPHDVLERLLGLAPRRVEVHVHDEAVTLTGRDDAATDLPAAVRPCRSVAAAVAVHPHPPFAYGGADLDVEPPQDGASPDETTAWRKPT